MSKDKNRYSGSTNPGVETTEEVAPVVKTKYRLFCEACTGVAKISTNPTDGGVVTCAKCGSMTPQKAANWIQM